MAIRVPIISDFDQTGVNKALQSFNKLKYDISAADGAMNKFKVASGAAFNFAKQNALAFGAAAAASVGAFVVKAVSQFQNLALAVDKFSNATGTSLEEASRLIEVMGDMGLSSESLQASLNKLNRAAASGAEGFAQIGAEIARTSSGGVDVQQTFFNVIDALKRIQDPALRAKAATELLGRGWTELSRLVGEGSAKLKRSLEAVSDTKVIDKAEVQKAKDFQAAIDGLKDVGEDFAIMVAQKLLPVLTRLVQLLELAGEVMGTATLTAEDMNEYLGKTVFVTEEMARVWKEGYDALRAAQDPAYKLTQELQDLEEQTANTKDEWNRFKGALNIELEMLNIEQQIAEFDQTWTQAMIDGTFNANEFQAELLQNRIALANLAEEVGLTKNAITNTVMTIMVNTQPLERALQLIQMIRSAQLGINQTRGGTYYTTPYGSIPTGNYSPFAGIPKMAEGGIVNGATLAMIGEAGPEAVIPLDRLGTMGGITVNVTGSVISENDLIETIRQGLVNAQRNGSQLLYTNS